LEWAVAGKVMAKEKYQYFNGLYKKMRLQLKETKGKATDYLHQLSFASRFWDSTWAEGLHLNFETFKTWWKDPARKIDLNRVNIKDIQCTGEAIQRLTSLSREEMPNAVGIDRFDYRPEAIQSKVVPEDGDAREAFENAEAAPAAQDPLLLLKGRLDSFSVYFL
jgi:hypothetical protein